MENVLDSSWVQMKKHTMQDLLEISLESNQRSHVNTKTIGPVIFVFDVFVQGPVSKDNFDKEEGAKPYQDLLSLLREKSPRFSEMIDKKVTHVYM